MAEYYCKPQSTIYLKRPAFNLSFGKGDLALEHPTSLGVSDVSLLNYMKSGNYRKSSLQLCRQYLRQRRGSILHDTSSMTTGMRRTGAGNKKTVQKTESKVFPCPSFKELSSLPQVVHSLTSIHSTRSVHKPTKTSSTNVQRSKESKVAKVSQQTASECAPAQPLTAKKQKAKSEEKVKSATKQTSRVVSDPGARSGPPGVRDKLRRPSIIKTSPPQKVKSVNRKTSVLSDLGPKTASVHSGQFAAAASAPNVRPASEGETPVRDTANAKRVYSTARSPQTMGSKTGPAGVKIPTPKASVKSLTGRPATAAGKTPQTKGKAASPLAKAQSAESKVPSNAGKTPSTAGKARAKEPRGSPKVNKALSEESKLSPGAGHRERPKTGWACPASRNKSSTGISAAQPVSREGHPEGWTSTVRKLSEQGLQKGEKTGPDQKAEKIIPVKKKPSKAERKMAMLMELIPRARTFADEDQEGSLSRMGFKPPQWEKRYAWSSMYAKWLQ